MQIPFSICLTSKIILIQHQLSSKKMPDEQIDILPQVAGNAFRTIGNKIDGQCQKVYFLTPFALWNILLYFWRLRKKIGRFE